MILAFNTRLLIKDKLDGIGWFTFHTLKRIVKNNPEHTFYFIFDRKYSDEFIFAENVKPVIVGPPTRHPVLWNFWLRYSLPRFLKKIKADIFVSPDGFLPYEITIPSLIVIHDINFVHRPKDLPYLTALFYLKRFSEFAQKAGKIATVSEYSKNDITNTYLISPKKISVVYNGADEAFKPVEENIKIKIRNKYSDGKPYFVFVGSLHPRKNIIGLIEAFDVFKKKTNSDLKLLIVGPFFFKNSTMMNIYKQLKYKDDILFTGRLDMDELTKVVGSAYALTMVSYFEGFGIPLLEAMYCDVPVISSNVTSMPEVTEEAALYVNPSDIYDIADKMEKMASNNELRESLIKKGRIQRTKFSWDKTAEKLWNEIEKLMQEVKE